MSSHVMELVESLCDRLAVVSSGRVLAAGTLDEVRAGSTLQQRFLDLVGFTAAGEGSLAWLRSSSASS
jgi:ABC-2 type transport system ATP-binding protein